MGKGKKLQVKKDFGEILDSSMDTMEETRFRKRNQNLMVKLSRKYHFNFTEVERLLLIYYKLSKESKDPRVGVDKTQFRDVLHCALDMTDDSLMDRIFLALDKGPSAFISMETWIASLSVFLRGTFEEHIHFCFSVYDIMGDGILSRDTMTNLLKNSIVSQTGDDDAEETARDMIEVITKKMDIDRDGKISFNDYKQSVVKQPMLLEVFGQCLPTRTDIHTFVTTFTNDIGKM
ncbi:hypothetical protein NQ318_014592 [Aromia moschata]|uniref:EF-hand domain-containing protein n=1 Tax=Aromia moschata TaxID=1265417 RepID=A0AAV8ZD96_9CUCU|nr:hypothetical protein NQ318_014592 [Aromia moschata]